MALPEIKITKNTQIVGYPTEGELQYQYSPFRNLNNEGLKELNLSIEDANIDVSKPILISSEFAYDDSTNLIISDTQNPVKLINSRFSIKDSETYEVADRKGSLDTNIYTRENFKSESLLVKTVNSIVSVDLKEVVNGGKMSIGSYHFYLKLADSDGNESDIIAETGKIVCSVGNYEDPKSVRGGLSSEDSSKMVVLEVRNLDLAYSYINVYFTRSTGDNAGEITLAYKITDKIPITDVDQEITISGFENTESIDLSEINNRYASFDSVGSLDICQNINFVGDITNDYGLFRTLENYSLFITPEIAISDTVGTIDTRNYKNTPSNNPGEYLNPDNIYYRLGYWNDEIYRFGIVYILQDYTLSPVFNIRGIKELKHDTEFSIDGESIEVDKEVEYNENYIIQGTEYENVKGVVKISSELKKVNNDEFLPLGIKFNFHQNLFTGRGLDKITRGFFIVRQKRIPTILAQGIGIATSKKSNTPTIKSPTYFKIESFLDYSEAAKPILKSSFRDLKRDDVFTNALICPEATLRSSLYRPLFNGSTFKLQDNKIQLTSNSVSNKRFFSHYNLGRVTPKELFESDLLYIPSGVELTSLGDYKFSSKAGDSLIAYSYLDAKYGDYADPANEIETVAEYNLQDKLRNYFDGGDPIKLSLDQVEEKNKNLEKYYWQQKHNWYYEEELKNNGEIIGKRWWAASWEGRYYLFRGAQWWYKLSWYQLGNTKKDSDASIFKDSPYKLRGEFNDYIGLSTEVTPNRIYNIFEDGYDFENNWIHYFKTRGSDPSPFYPINNRTSWEDLIDKQSTNTLYRGDCYLSTYTHKMNWGFIDPELPTNTRIIDTYTWHKNFYIIYKLSTGVIYDETKFVDINSDEESSFIKLESYHYRKLLLDFTYKMKTAPEWKDYQINLGENDEAYNEPNPDSILEPDDKRYTKYVEQNGLFGANQINRADVNAVNLGHYYTFKIFSNHNLALRDIDFSNPQEEAVHSEKRTFYPFGINRLPESKILNPGISKTHGDRVYMEVPDVPFIKTNFSTRIYYSNPLVRSYFSNGNRIFKSTNYQDYTLEHGKIIKLVEWYGRLIVVLEHGVLLIPVNERAMMKNESGDNIYINTDNVLPKNPRVLSNTYGSKWSTAIVKSPKYIYGIDTVAKKIWRTNGEEFQIISDVKIQKFLNDNINLKLGEELISNMGEFIKIHYNAFKSDVLFTYKVANTEWHLCWNELQDKWVTRYTWLPEFSENINNIFYTFASQGKYGEKRNILYKHGFAGTNDIEGRILPTYWYDKQEKFEFEFVVVGDQGIQKIFNNMKIISNYAEPESFTYEVVGEGFDWHKDKSIVKNYTTDNDFKNYLIGTTPKVPKLPYIWKRSIDENSVRDVVLKENNKTKELLVNIYQKGLDISNPRIGRLRGNMAYVEDSWDIQIQPITFKYAYLDKNNNLTLTNRNEMKIRDKYIKIRITYDGSKYAIVNAIRTMFTLSYA